MMNEAFIEMPQLDDDGYDSIADLWGLMVPTLMPLNDRARLLLRAPRHREAVYHDNDMLRLAQNNPQDAEEVATTSARSYLPPPILSSPRRLTVMNGAEENDEEDDTGYGFFFHPAAAHDEPAVVFDEDSDPHTVPPTPFITLGNRRRNFQRLADVSPLNSSLTFVDSSSPSGASLPSLDVSLSVSSYSYSRSSETNEPSSDSADEPVWDSFNSRRVSRSLRCDNCPLAESSLMSQRIAQLPSSRQDAIRDFLLRTDRDGHRSLLEYVEQQECFEGLVLLQLAVWKMLCILDRESTLDQEDHVVGPYRPIGLAAAWQLTKDEFACCREIQVIRILVGPFLMASNE